MDFTGIEYLLYSNKDNSSVMDEFKKRMCSIGYNLIEREEDKAQDYLSYFFAKNKEMLDLHLEIGYNTNLNSEGCVYLYSGVELLNNPFIVPETMNLKKRHFQYVWFPGRYYYYMITLPGDIEKDEFSRKIFNFLKEILEA